MVSSNSGTVLLVDADEDICQLMVIILGKLGYDGICAHSKDEAKQFLQTNPKIKLVVLEILLPEKQGGDRKNMGGVELMEEMYDGGSICSIPTLYCTVVNSINKSESPLLERISKIHAPKTFGFLHKPFGIEEFEDKVKTMLAKNE